MSKHFTHSAATRRMGREIEKLNMPGKRSSGWQRRKFMVRPTHKLVRRYKVVEL